MNRALVSFVIASCLAFPATAFGQLNFPRDLTGSDLARAAKPDFARIRTRSSRGAGFAGAPTVEVRRNHVYVLDVDGVVPSPFQTQQDLQAALELAASAVYEVLPDELLFIYVFTSFETGVGGFFYAPLANSDQGIGQEVHDDTGPSPLEGIVFMNDWHAFDSFLPPGTPRDVKEGFMRSVFNQEAAHRWGSFADFGPGVGDGFLDPLMGRDRAHWSYFADTGGSPLEGNAWQDNGNGSFTTRTDVRSFAYSDLDLYLMGVLPPEQVRPWFAIINPNTAGAFDISGQQINASSPPQIFDPQTIRGTRRDYAISDVVDRFGPRNPSVALATHRWRSAFVMLANLSTPLGEAQKREFEVLVDLYAAGFASGARGLGSLDYELMNRPQLVPIGGACTLSNECDPQTANLCITPLIGGPNYCSHSCSVPAECPPTWCCGNGACQISGCIEPTPDAGVEDTGSFVADASAPDADMIVLDAGTSTTPAECTCDLTFSCDPACACDRECIVDRGGAACGCHDTGARAGAPWLFFALLIAWGVRRIVAR